MAISPPCLPKRPPAKTTVAARAVRDRDRGGKRGERGERRGKSAAVQAIESVDETSVVVAEVAVEVAPIAAPVAAAASEPRAERLNVLNAMIAARAKITARIAAMLRLPTTAVTGVTVTANAMMVRRRLALAMTFRPSC